MSSPPSAHHLERLELPEAGKWINWPVETAFDRDRFMPAPFTGLWLRPDAPYGQTRITEMATNMFHLFQ